MGSAPVGVALSEDGQVAVVADSNRFAAPFQASTATIVNTAAVLAGRPALTATVPVGGFPREVTIIASTNLAAITDFGTGEISLITTTS